jgi:hypothetical protein
MKVVLETISFYDLEKKLWELQEKGYIVSFYVEDD